MRWDKRDEKSGSIEREILGRLSDVRPLNKTQTSPFLRKHSQFPFTIKPRYSVSQVRIIRKLRIRSHSDTAGSLKIASNINTSSPQSTMSDAAGDSEIVAAAPTAAEVSKPTKKVKAPKKVAVGGAKSPKKAAKPKAPSDHPKISVMVNGAIKGLGERGGSSLKAIKKYITDNYKVDAEKLAPFIRRYLKSGVTGGQLVQVKGKGANGSFRLPTKGAAAVGGAKPIKVKKAVVKPKKAAGSPKKPKATKPKVKKVAPGTPKPKAKAGKPKKAETVASASPAKSKKVASPAKKVKPAAPKKAAAASKPKTAKSPKKPKSPKPKKAAKTKAAPKKAAPKKK